MTRLFNIALPIALLALSACTKTKDLSGTSNSASVIEHPECRPGTCVYEITDQEVFKENAEVLDADVTPQHVVKIIYHRDRQGDGKVYFINTKVNQFHYDFARNALGLRLPLQLFNRNYEGTGVERDYNLGSLILNPEYENGEKYLMEIWSGDTLEGEYLREFVDKVKEKVNGAIVFHPLSIQQEDTVKASQTNPQHAIDFITTADLYANKKYWPLNRGEAYGYLKFVNDENPEQECLDHTSIVVYKNVPNDLGLVGGVITEGFQTPLSHINVKSINRGTVNMSLKQAQTEFLDYKDKPVRLSVTRSGYEITLLEPSNADQKIADFWSSRRPNILESPNPQVSPEFDNMFVRFDEIFRGPRLLPATHKSYIANVLGAKATNLAVIKWLIGPRQNRELGVYSPDGLGVPFNFYDKFMDLEQVGLIEATPEVSSTPRKVVTKMLNDAQLLQEGAFHSICEAKDTLEKVRNVILKSKVPAAQLDLFEKYIFDLEDSPIHISKHPRIRLRSSTNSEDLEGFTGAGLYNSKGLALYKKHEDGSYNKQAPKTREKIREKLSEILPYLYSSVWNDRAYAEREWYQVDGQDHLKIKVGLAVHKAFPGKDFDHQPGEVANGVAISKNIYRLNEVENVYINGQHFDLAVTNPPTAEELEEYGEDPTKPYKTEEIVVTTYLPTGNETPESYKEWSFEKLSRSSVKEGENVLRPEAFETQRLAKVMKYMNQYFAILHRTLPEDFAIDVEWKVYGPERQLWVKQARPFATAQDPSDFADDGDAFRVQPVRPPVRLGPIMYNEDGQGAN